MAELRDELNGASLANPGHAMLRKAEQAAEVLQVEAKSRRERATRMRKDSETMLLNGARNLELAMRNEREAIELDAEAERLVNETVSTVKQFVAGESAKRVFDALGKLGVEFSDAGDHPRREG